LQKGKRRVHGSDEKKGKKENAGEIEKKKKTGREENENEK